MYGPKPIGGGTYNMFGGGSYGGAPHNAPFSRHRAGYITKRRREDDYEGTPYKSWTKHAPRGYGYIAIDPSSLHNNKITPSMIDPQYPAGQDWHTTYGYDYKTADPSQRQNRDRDGYYGNGTYVSAALGFLKGRAGPALRGAIRGGIAGANTDDGLGGILRGALGGAATGLITGAGTYAGGGSGAHVNSLFASSKKKINMVPIQQQDGDMLRLSDTEEIMTVYGNPIEYATPEDQVAGKGRVKDLQQVMIDITPGNNLHFPKLSKLVPNWSEYHMLQCIFIFESTIPQNLETKELNYGEIIMATQHDYDAQEWTHIDQMKDHHNSTCGRIEVLNRKPFLHGVECDAKKLPGDGHKRIRLGGILDSNRKDYDQGRFYFNLQGTPESLAGKPIGKLKMYYTLVLRNRNDTGHKGQDIKETHLIKDMGVTGALVGGTDVDSNGLPSDFTGVVPTSSYARGHQGLELLFKDFDTTADKILGSSVPVKVTSYGHPARGHTTPDIDLHDYNKFPANAKDIVWPSIIPTHSVTVDGVPTPKPFPCIAAGGSSGLDGVAINYMPVSTYTNAQWGDTQLRKWEFGYNFAPVQIEFPQTLTGNYEITITMEGVFGPHGAGPTSTPNEITGVHATTGSTTNHLIQQPWRAAWSPFDEGQDYDNALSKATEHMFYPTDITELPIQLPEGSSWTISPGGIGNLFTQNMAGMATDNGIVGGLPKHGMRHLYPIVTGNVALNRDLMVSGTGTPYQPYGLGDPSRRDDLKQTSFRFDSGPRRITYTCHVHLSRATQHQGTNRILLKIPVCPSVPNSESNRWMAENLRVNSAAVRVTQYNAHSNLGNGGQPVVDPQNVLTTKYSPNVSAIWT